MKRTFERATAILAVTAGIAAGSAAVKAETASAASAQARAMNVAKEITKDLYKPGNSSMTAPVPGILNGSVQMKVDAGKEKYTVRDENPIVLVESHPASATEKNPDLLNGSWIGMPNIGANNQVVITPFQLKLGNHNGENISLNINNNHNPAVLDGAGVQAQHTHNGPDKLFAVDLHGHDFPKSLIQTAGVK